MHIATSYTPCKIKPGPLSRGMTLRCMHAVRPLFPATSTENIDGSFLIYYLQAFAAVASYNQLRNNLLSVALYVCVLCTV